MNLEMVFHRGERDKPLVIFIHGMGMNVKAWSEPSKARILGGKYPLRVLLDGHEELETTFTDLKKLGFHVLSWTQSRPVGPMQIAVNELKELIKKYHRYYANGIILIGHSRGGLLARKYLEKETAPVRGLITLATPHRGTSMARLAVYASPITSALDLLLKGFNKKDVDSALQRVLGFFCSSGLKDLLPDSEFFSNLKDKKLEGTVYISIGGTKPDLLKAISISLPKLMSKVIPEKILPEEMREDYGDGLVSAASSVLPYTDEHINFPVNHASILVDGEVREYILKKISLI